MSSPLAAHHQIHLWVWIIFQFSLIAAILKILFLFFCNFLGTATSFVTFKDLRVLAKQVFLWIDTDLFLWSSIKDDFFSWIITVVSRLKLSFFNVNYINFGKLYTFFSCNGSSICDNVHLSVTNKFYAQRHAVHKVHKTSKYSE